MKTSEIIKEARKLLDTQSHFLCFCVDRFGTNNSISAEQTISIQHAIVAEIQNLGGSNTIMSLFFKANNKEVPYSYTSVYVYTLPEYRAFRDKWIDDYIAKLEAQGD